MAITNKVRHFREERGESLRELSAAVGIDPGHLSKLEQGIVGCSDERKLRLADHFGVEIQDLFFQRSVENQEAVSA